MHGFRKWSALLIAFGVVLYLVLFVIKDYRLPVEEYSVMMVYTVHEVIIISCFVLYLSLFAPDLYRLGAHHGRPVAVGEGAERA